jgi:excinuclease UvrABC nuclease subunit
MPFNNNHAYSFNEDWIEAEGVYGIMNPQWQMIYIGETDNLRKRMREHVYDKAHCINKHNPSLVLVEFTISESTRKNRASQLIAEYNPPCNQ